MTGGRQERRHVALIFNPAERNEILCGEADDKVLTGDGHQSDGFTRRQVTAGHNLDERRATRRCDTMSQRSSSDPRHGSHQEQDNGQCHQGSGDAIPHVDHVTISCP